MTSLKWEAIGDHKLKGEILKEATGLDLPVKCLKAAFKAAALAVAEETEAARAAGGGDSARLLAPAAQSLWLLLLCLWTWALGRSEVAEAPRQAEGGVGFRRCHACTCQARFEVHNDFRIDELNESGPEIACREALERSRRNVRAPREGASSLHILF